MNDLLEDARKVLQRVFGHSTFIGKQSEVILQILQGGNSLAIMPTGGGKSICYQIPALVRDGTAIVISPLIALMKDQVDGLIQHNVRAAFLNSSLTYKKTRAVEEAFLKGDLDLLYIAPERLMTDSGIEFIKQSNLSLIAIDEAHCVSQWGHDFRPEYLRLGELAKLFPQVPRVALTATADTQTRREIIEKLYLDDAKITIASFDRPNIRYGISQKNNMRQQFLDFYKREHQDQSGIIYCLSRRRVEETAEWLEKTGINALPYHAGMTTKIRTQYQERFLREESMVMCATIAFGMGIDKPNVRFVVHFDLPKSIEGLYQETGRGGRDGLPSNALLFYGLNDAINIRKMVDDSNAPEHIRRIEHQKLNALLALCESSQCRRMMLLRYFGEEYIPPCGNCDNCLNPPETWDGTEAAQKFLSAAFRTRQIFGVGHLVDVLIGKETEKIIRFNHQTLPTFGVGSDITAGQWRSLARQMIAADLLAPNETYGALKITEKGMNVLRNNERIMFTREAKKEKKAEKERVIRTKIETQLSREEAEIFEILRAERYRLSQLQNVPAYIIFHDIVLIEMARRLPTNKDDFALIPGVGKAKLDRYADSFINKINVFLAS